MILAQNFKFIYGYSKVKDLPPEKNISGWIRRKSFEVFIVHGLGVVLLFVMHSVITRAVGPADYGKFSHALAISTMVASIGVLGWPTALMRFIAEYETTANWSLLRGVLLRGYQISTCSTVMIGLILWSLPILPFFPADLAVNFRFAGFITPLIGLILVSRRALRGFHVILPSIIPPEIILPLVVWLGVFVLSITTAIGALWLYAFSALICLLILLKLIHKRFIESVGQSNAEYQTRFWITTAVPMMFSNFTQMVMKRIDILMLGFLTPFAEVGFYSAAFRVSALALFVKTAVNTVVAPIMAASFKKGNHKRYYKVLFGSAALSAVATLPIAGIMIIWPSLPLSFFGQEFIAGASPILALLAVAQFIDSATGPVGTALLMTGRERIVLFVNMTVAIIKVIISYIAIKNWGAIGVAWVTLLSISVINGLYWFHLLRRRK